MKSDFVWSCKILEESNHMLSFRDHCARVRYEAWHDRCGDKDPNFEFIIDVNDSSSGSDDPSSDEEDCVDLSDEEVDKE